MRTGIRVCGSDELKVLQAIADSVVEELSTFPTYKTIDKMQLHRQVGKEVFNTCDKGHLLTVDELKHAVLAKFQN